MEHLAGIYKISVDRGARGEKYYIGQAAVIRDRRKRHFNALRGGYHRNRALQRDFSKYGEAAVRFDVLLLSDVGSLTMYEQAIVDLYADRPLYNVQRQCVDSPRGVKRSMRARQKMAEAQLGKTLSPEHRAKIRAACRGKKLGPASESARQNMRQAAKDRRPRPCSEEARLKISAAHKGKIVTAETRAKQSISQKRRFASAAITG